MDEIIQWWIILIGRDVFQLVPKFRFGRDVVLQWILQVLSPRM